MIQLLMRPPNRSISVRLGNYFNGGRVRREQRPLAIFALLDSKRATQALWSDPPAIAHSSIPASLLSADGRLANTGPLGAYCYG
jgi:hypothetical protein